MNPSPEPHANPRLQLPRVVQMRVIPIAGHDGMLLNPVSYTHLTLPTIYSV